MQVFVIINKDWMKINAAVNVKNWLIKVVVISNPSNYECECDKSCNIGEYLDYENCKCRKKLVDKLVKECTKNVDEKKKIIQQNCIQKKQFLLYAVLTQFTSYFFFEFYNKYWNCYLFYLLQIRKSW